MNKNYRWFLVTGLLMCFGLFFWTFNFSAAQQQINAQFESSNQITQSQVSDLISQIGNLATAIGQQNQPSVQPVEPVQASTTTGNQIGNPAGCGKYIGERFEWESSLYRDTDVEWSVDDFPLNFAQNAGVWGIETAFIDINGDGLVDYLQKRKILKSYSLGSLTDQGIITNGNYAEEDSCVLLNNGKGWDVAYKCVTGLEANPLGGGLLVKYYGDCADTSQ